MKKSPKLRAVLFIWTAIFISLPILAQRNNTQLNKYLINPYPPDPSMKGGVMEGVGKDFLKSLLGDQLGNVAAAGIGGDAPAPFNTRFQPGYVVLLDGTRLEGDVALGGRCLSDIYTVNMKNCQNYITVGSKAQQFMQSGIISFGKFSIKEFGLTDISESETDDSLYQWTYAYENRDYGQAMSTNEIQKLNIDSAGITGFASNYFSTGGKKFFHHEILLSKRSPGFAKLANGNVIKGEIVLTKLNGTIVKISIYQDGERKPTEIAPYRVETYGLIRQGSNAPSSGGGNDGDPYADWGKNETPTAFKFTSVIANSQNTKKFDGYIVRKDGTRQSGEMKIRAFLTGGDIKFKPEGEKKYLEIPFTEVTSYGVDGATKDESINDTPGSFKFDESKLSGNGSAYDQFGEIYALGKKYSLQDEGYVVLKNGKRLEGTVRLKAMIYYVTEVSIKPDGQDDQVFPIEEVAHYGLNVNSNAAGRTDRESFLAYNILQLKPIEVKGLTVSSNPKLIRRYFDDGSMESEFKAGYVVTADGETILGELQEKESYDTPSLKFQEFEGKKYDLLNMIGKLKKDFVEYGYFDTPTISEFPMHLYTPKRPGYITLIDGRTVHGVIKISFPKNGVIKSVGTSLDKCGTVTEYSFKGKKASKTRRVQNAYLYDEIFYVKIKKGEEKLKDIKNDMILRIGLDDVKLSELNFSEDQLVQNDKLNFHPGYIETKEGKRENGYVSFIEGSEPNSYYGVYFAKGQEDFVTVYRMEELKDAQQEIYDDIEAFDPFGEGVIESQEMNSTGNLETNGRVVFEDGSVKKGHLEIFKSPKLWYSYSMKFTDEGGVSTTFDQNNTFQSAYLTKGDKEVKFVPYAGVICEVIMESAPYQYFRNPYPKKETAFSRMLNQSIAEASTVMMEEATKEFVKTDKISTTDKVVILNMIDTDAEMPDVNVQVNKKEYILYDTVTKRGYVVVKGGVAPYIADIDDLKNGCISYLQMPNERRKMLNKVEDPETGLGMQSQIDFLCNCYHPEMVQK